MSLVHLQTTAATKAEAEKIAQALLAARLAACVQITGPIESHYHWQGKIEQAAEFLCLIKTDQKLFAAVEKVIKDNHSYELPEIIALPIVEASSDYRDWLTKNLQN